MTDPRTLRTSSKAEQPMMATVLSSFIFSEMMFMQGLGFPDIVMELWNEWELRVLVLVSLILQIILITRGRGRKYISENKIRITLWCAYLLADWTANFALGLLLRLEGKSNCKDQSPCTNNGLKVFWAPFLLLHLGGPDTISAYSLEDNELWLRHLLGLFFQSGMAAYVTYKFRNDSVFSILTIPMFVAGMIKYGERTWVLWSMSSKAFRDSLLPRPDPGPNYAKFMEQYRFKKVEGFILSTGDVIEPQKVTSSSYNVDETQVVVQDIETSVTNVDPHTETLVKAYGFFSIFKLLFVDLILCFHDRDRSRLFFQNKSSKEAFEVVEIELGFMYDLLFTKAKVNYTLVGLLLRFITFYCTIVVFVFFVIAEKQNYSIIDQFITYLLLAVAIVLEIYAVILLCSSDWTNLWLSKRKITSTFQPNIRIFQLPSKPRWSKSMAQYNLLSVCLEEKPATCPEIQKLFGTYEMLEKHRYKTYNGVSERLEKLIFHDLKEKAFGKEMDLQVLYTCRGGIAIGKYNRERQYEWTINAEFDRSILLWHIATELCYYHDFGDPPSQIQEEGENSKLISDYMLYLLVMCPFMLPMGIGMIRFRDTRAEATEFFQENRSFFSGKAEACKLLLWVESEEVLPITIKGDRSKSVLFDACRLAKSLLKEGEKRWEMMSLVWVEMLSYAASHCRGNYHARQLSQGGELLTHLWLLMAHLGITEQFQIDQGHIRAKLIVT